MFKEFVDYLASEKITLRSMVVFTAASSLLILFIPFVIQALIQQYTLLVFQPSTVFLVLSVGIFLVGITLMRVLQMQLSEYFQRRLFLTAVGNARSLSNFYRCHNKTMPQKKWNYIFESVSLQKSIVPLFFDGFTFLLQSVLVILFISFYHPFFALYSTILVFAFYWVTIGMGRSTLKHAYDESDKKHDLIYDLQSGSELGTTKDKYEERVVDYFATREKRYNLYLRQSIGLFLIKIFAATTLLIVGGLLVFQNQMTIGQLIASELIVVNLLISLFKFSNLLDYYYDSATALRKLRLLKEKGMSNDK